MVTKIAAERLDVEYVETQFKRMSRDKDSVEAHELFDYYSRPFADGALPKTMVLDKQRDFFFKYCGDDLKMDRDEFIAMHQDVEYEDIARKLGNGGIYKIKDDGLLSPNWDIMWALERTEPVDAANKEKFETVYSQFVKNLYLEPSTNPKVVDLENKMQELGVAVSFCDDLSTAQAVYEACKIAKENGASLPRQILMADLKPGICGFTSRMKLGNEANSVIIFQRGLGDKTEFSSPNSLARQIGCRHSVNESPVGVVLHELGHFNHALRSPDEFFKQSVVSSFGGEDPKLKTNFDLAKKVSFYSVCDANPREFVAEVYCGLLSGETYDKGVMKLYKEYSGPSVKKK